MGESTRRKLLNLPPKSERVITSTAKKVREESFRTVSGILNKSWRTKT